MAKYVSVRELKRKIRENVYSIENDYGFPDDGMSDVDIFKTIDECKKVDVFQIQGKINDFPTFGKLNCIENINDLAKEASNKQLEFLAKNLDKDKIIVDITGNGELISRTVYEKVEENGQPKFRVKRSY